MGGRLSLADTASEGVGQRCLLFKGTASDLPFLITGLLLIARGMLKDRERGWILIGIGALCWALGDVYWNINLSTMSSLSSCMGGRRLSASFSFYTFCAAES